MSTLRLPAALLLVLAACAPEEPQDTAPSTDTGEPDTGGTDTADSAEETGDTAPPNDPPSAPVVAISPTVPAAGVAMAAQIVTEATDPNGDAVSYSYAWAVNGADAGIADPEVPGSLVVDGDVWDLTVMATDGAADSAPATARATVGNAPPSAFGIEWEYSECVDGDEIVLRIDPEAVDPEGDPLTTTLRWTKNGTPVDWFDDLTVIESKWVNNEDTFEVTMSVTDGFHDPQVETLSITCAYTCDNPPPEAYSETSLADSSGYHGLLFTADGYQIGLNSAQSLMMADIAGNKSVFIPNFGTAQQMDVLPDGDYVIGDSTTNTLVRVTPDGGQSVIASGFLGVYGVTVGPDGMIYASYQSVVRVDPDTGEQTTIFNESSAFAHAVAFNLDSTVMYVGTIGGGTVYAVALDSDLNPTGVSTYATGVGGYHDGLEVDECGFVYVADYSTRSLYRIDSSGTSTSMVPAVPAQYGHGTVWGNGVGGWETTHLYQPQPYNGNTVRDVDIGFESGDLHRTWNGVAVSY